MIADIARDRKTKILPLMTLIALISAESGNEIYRKGATGAMGQRIAVIARAWKG